MGRKDYMEGRIGFQEFYLAVADAIGRQRLENVVRAYIGTPEYIRTHLSADENLNNIQLKRWDALHPAVLQMVRENGKAVMAVSWDGQPLTPGTVAWSLGESVCVLKAVAKEMARQCDSVTRFVLTYVNADGHRTLLDGQQGRFTYDTEAEAQAHLDAIIANTSPERIAQLWGKKDDIQVRACECWPGHHDPKGIWFDQ